MGPVPQRLAAYARRIRLRYSSSWRGIAWRTVAELLGASRSDTEGGVRVDGPSMSITHMNSRVCKATRTLSMSTTRRSGSRRNLITWWQMARWSVSLRPSDARCCFSKGQRSAVSGHGIISCSALRHGPARIRRTSVEDAVGE
jgi:hypothetical protein